MMRPIRLFVVAAAAAAMVIAGAPAALAANFTVNACERADYMFPNGSVITVVYGDGCQPETFVDALDVPLGFSMYTNQGVAGITDPLGTENATGLIALDSDDAWVVALSSPGASVYMQQWIAACGVLDPSVSADAGFTLDDSACPKDQTPAPIQQAVPLPASGTCTDVVDSGLGFQARVAGGWSMSWGEWAGNGLGGQVCERELVYSNAVGAWTVRS